MAKKDYNDCEACKRFFPQCPCLTCKKKYFKDGNCCFEHNKICSASCVDYEKEEAETDG